MSWSRRAGAGLRRGGHAVADDQVGTAGGSSRALDLDAVGLVRDGEELADVLGQGTAADLVQVGGDERPVGCGAARVDDLTGAVDDLPPGSGRVRGRGRGHVPGRTDEGCDDRGGLVELGVEPAVQGVLDAPVDERTGRGEQDEHRDDEARDEADPRGQAARGSTRYPAPRTVVMVLVPNGRSILAQMNTAVDVYDVAAQVGLAVPDRVEDGVARHDLPGPGDEQVEDVELARQSSTAVPARKTVRAAGSTTRSAICTTVCSAYVERRTSARRRARSSSRSKGLAR